MGLLYESSLTPEVMNTSMAAIISGHRISSHADNRVAPPRVLCCLNDHSYCIIAQPYVDVCVCHSAFSGMYIVFLQVRTVTHRTVWWDSQMNKANHPHLRYTILPKVCAHPHAMTLARAF